MPLYNGFSTINRQKKYRLSDFELAKQDLYNHLRIRKGEKLMNPEFGTIIWDMLFEQLTDETKTAIVDDLNRIIKYDPRIVADSLNIYEYENGLQLAVELRYIETNQVEFIKYNFDREQQL
jgi:phage baseplate assembly protein W